MSKWWSEDWHTHFFTKEVGTEMLISVPFGYIEAEWSNKQICLCALQANRPRHRTVEVHKGLTHEELHAQVVDALGICVLKELLGIIPALNQPITDTVSNSLHKQ
jgi:hypothetical protein